MERFGDGRLKHVYEVLRDARVAIVASAIFNLGVAIGILQDPSQNTPARIQQHFEVSANVLIAWYIIAGAILLIALPRRSYDLYVLGNIPIVFYAFFTIVTIRWGATVLPASVMVCLLLYIAHEVATWKD